MSAEQKVGDAVADEKKEVVAPEPSSIETKETPKPEVVEDFPDPDEDDLDDLDGKMSRVPGSYEHVGG